MEVKRSTGKVKTAENMPAAASGESSEALPGVENVPGMHDFRNGNKAWYKGEIVTVEQFIPTNTIAAFIYPPSAANAMSLQQLLRLLL